MSDKIVDSLDAMEEYGRRWERQKDLTGRYVPPPTADKVRLNGAAFEGVPKQKVCAILEEKCASTSAAANSEPKQRGKKNKQVAKQTEQRPTAPADSNKQSQAKAQSSANTFEFSAEFLAGFSRAWSEANADRGNSTGCQAGRTSPPPAMNFVRSVHREARTDQANSGRGGVAGARQPNSGQCYRCNEHGHFARQCTKYTCDICNEKGHVARNRPSKPAVT